MKGTRYMEKKKKTLFLITVLAVALCLPGCQLNNSTGGSGGINIYYSAIESGDYYEGWAAQLKEAAQDAGAVFNAGYAENSVEMQNTQIKAALDNGCNVFLCGPVSPDIVTGLKVAAGETPIVFINNAPEDGQLEKDQYIYVASDEYMAGQYQAEYILEKYKDKDEINVAILKGPRNASGAAGRTKGLKRTLNASGKKINYVFEDNADWSSDKAKEMIKIFFDTGNTADCIAANNDDMALGAIAAFEEAGRDLDSVLFLGVDASANGCQSVIDGKLDFTVYQDMASQISAAVNAAVKIAEGGTIEDIDGATKDGKYILIPFEKVDADNVLQYSQAINY